MKLATIRVGGGTRAVRIEGDRAIEIGFDDVGGALAAGVDAARKAIGPAHDASALDYAPLVLRPRR